MGRGEHAGVERTTHSAACGSSRRTRLAVVGTECLLVMRCPAAVVPEPRGRARTQGGRHGAAGSGGGGGGSGLALSLFVAPPAMRVVRVYCCIQRSASSQLGREPARRPRTRTVAAAPALTPTLPIDECAPIPLPPIVASRPCCSLASDAPPVLPGPAQPHALLSETPSGWWEPRRSRCGWQVEAGRAPRCHATTCAQVAQGNRSPNFRVCHSAPEK